MAENQTDSDAQRAGYKSDADTKALYLDYLVKKHADTIEGVLNLPIDKQKEVFRIYGLDPDKIMDRYPDLIKRNHYLKSENIALSGTAKDVSGIAAFSALTALLVTPKRIFNNSALLKGFFAVAGFISAGVATYFFSTKALTYRNRNDSLALSVEARNKLRENLGVMFELVERGELEPKVLTSEEKSLEKGPFAAKLLSDRGQQAQSHVEKLEQSLLSEHKAL